MATSARTSKRPAPSTASPRPRRKAAPAPAADDAIAAPPQNEEPAKNVGSLEGGLSLALGVLFVVAALFPRSIRQLLLLGIGTGLLYRGTTGKCSVYEALGIDTTKDSVLS